MIHNNGAIPRGWARASVDELVTLINGFAFKPSQWQTEGTPIIRIQNLNDSSKQFNHFSGELPEKFRVKDGDLLFAWSGTPGTSFGAHLWNRGEAWLNQHIFKVQFDRKNLNDRFVTYAINQNLQQYITAAHGGAGLAHITKGRFEASQILLAPLAEQRRIVERIEELFSELDAGVAALKRVQANLKRYQASVLKAAVEGKLTEEWRAGHTPKESGQQLLKRILAERRQKWEAEQLAAYEAKGKEPPENWRAKYKEPDAPDTSELPELPEGWCWATMDQLVCRSEYGTSQKCTYESLGDPVLRIPNIARGKIDLTDIKRSVEPLQIDTYAYLQKGDLLMCRTNGSISLIGKAAIVQQELPEHHSFASYLLRFRFVETGIVPLWVHQFIGSPQGRRFIESHAASSAGQHNISLGLLSTLMIPLPPLAEQQAATDAIDERLTTADALEHTTEKQLIRAARLRQSILKVAFEGKLIAQDPADEPAAELLARIKAERQAASYKPAPASRDERVPNKITQRRGAIVAYTIAQSNVRATGKSESLGRTKLVKVLYIAQTHEELDLQFRFQRYAAGPFDEAIFKLEGTANKNDWFMTKERKSYGVTYHTAANTEAMCEEAANFLGNQKDSFDRLLGHMAQMDMKQAELFATTYAAWNDLLIDCNEVNDDAIIEEFYAWDDSKKKFKRSDILKQLKWMRSESYLPTGKGHRTEIRTKETKLPSKKRGRKNAQLS